MPKHCTRVLGLLCVLMVITYLDRICISVAGPRIQEALAISPIAWGWVTGGFTLAYAIFEVPSGSLGDRIGPRLVLTRIVLWWSAFTAFTGLATSYYPLVAIRFLFGMGEAGAFPNASIAISRWFPIRERGRAFGLTLMSSQMGGALAPLLVVPIQAAYGWRASFFVFALLGVLWSAVWYVWFRDSPAQMQGVSDAELAETSHLTAETHRAIPWRRLLSSPNLWTVMGVGFCYVYSHAFFQSWFHTYLVKAHGYREKDLLLSSLPFLVGAVGNIAGGLASAYAVRQVGLKKGRCGIGFAGLTVAAVAVAAALIHPQWLVSLLLLSLAYGAICFQQPSLFAACLDIGRENAGATVGAMNTACQAGSFLAAVLFGYLVQYTGTYEAPLIPMAVLLAVGAALWLKVDPRKALLESA
ncbi:MAG: MFS transporter [Bryobacteraceae bacterium]|nr:MFS transporter [Bryobacteraceae bacterium]